MQNKYQHIYVARLTLSINERIKATIQRRGIYCLPLDTLSAMKTATRTKYRQTWAPQRAKHEAVVVTISILNNSRQIYQLCTTWKTAAARQRKTWENRCRHFRSVVNCVYVNESQYQLLLRPPSDQSIEIQLRAEQCSRKHKKSILDSALLSNSGTL